ncbi:MAG: glycine zipper 2TM domain-containing protein [Luteolibacter sp.]
MKTIIALATLPFLFVSCAQDTLTGDTYSRSETGQAQTVKKGRITSIRYVKIEGGNTAGAIIGGVAGGVLGNQIGGGAGRTLATVGGAGVGAVAGSHAQQSMQNRQGIEIEVRLDGGAGTLSVTQEVNPNDTFSQGDRVRVLYNGGRARVSH